MTTSRVHTGFWIPLILIAFAVAPLRALAQAPAEEPAQLRVARDQGGIEPVWRGVVLAADSCDELLVQVDTRRKAGNHRHAHSRK